MGLRFYFVEASRSVKTAKINTLEIFGYTPEVYGICVIVSVCVHWYKKVVC